MGNLVFPSLPGADISFKRTSIWTGSRHQENFSGKRVFYNYWSYPRYRYELTHNLLRENLVTTEYAQLIGFINSLNGPYDTFQFTDPDDNLVINQNIGTGNGSNLGPFLVARSLGGFIEPILAVNTGVAATVEVNGVTQTFGTAWTWSFGGPNSSWPNGVIFLSGHAPGAGQDITISGGFYWVCNFIDVENTFDRLFIARYAMKSLKFETYK